MEFPFFITFLGILLIKYSSINYDIFLDAYYESLLPPCPSNMLIHCAFIDVSFLCESLS